MEVLTHNDLKFKHSFHKVWFFTSMMFLRICSNKWRVNLFSKLVSVLLLQCNWLVQWDSRRDLQLDGDVRLQLQWKLPPLQIIKQNIHPSCSTYTFHSVPVTISLLSLHLSHSSQPLTPCLHSVLYGVTTTWVSPPEVSSCIRVPVAGRSTPVAQLWNILEEHKDSEAIFL